MNRTTRTTRYALIRYHYCTSNQSLTTRCLTNYWPKKLVQRFWRTDTVTVKRKKHLRAAGSPVSLAQRPVKNPTLRSGPFRIDQNVSIEYSTSECSGVGTYRPGAIRCQCGTFAFLIYPEPDPDDRRAFDKFERSRKVAPMLSYIINTNSESFPTKSR